MNGVNIVANLNIFPFSSYDILIGIERLGAHHVVLDSHNMIFTCLDEGGKQITMKANIGPIYIREISFFQLKR
jgi:hypothetical protein